MPIIYRLHPLTNRLEQIASGDRIDVSVPDGAYTTLRSYNGTALLGLTGHLDRLEETAALLGQPITLDRAALYNVLCQVLRGVAWAGAQESRLRITIDCTVHPGDIWLSVEALTTPTPSDYAQGVRVLTRTMHRDNPRAKNSAFITASQSARQLIGNGINEVLMTSADGAILEGVSSNFFALYRGQLLTADEGVLPGITRSLILAEAEAAGIEIVLSSLPLAAVGDVSEAFISSTSRAILPVVQIDNELIGDGKPGPMTQELARRLTARITQELTDVCL